jgi:SAM-dependent methyltransferase
MFRQKERRLERDEFEKMHRVEDSMWWYAGLHQNLITALRQRLPATSKTLLLDAGCGTGGLLRKLAQGFAKLSAIGLDADEAACAFASRKSGQAVCAGSINSLPFADNAFAAIVSADVICHAAVDEAGAVGNFHRCLAPGGVVVINVPAYQWMYSSHDRAVHTARRYTRARLHALLRNAGFHDIRTTHWNTVLFPLMVARRLATRRQEGSDVMPYPAPVDRIFRAAMRLENALLRRGMSLPFGGSVMATAVKP